MLLDGGFLGLRRDHPQHQPYLTAIAEELNNRPRACLGFRTPQEVFQKQLIDGVDSTN
ncbi:hypothetical protein FHS13_003032 [Nocardiopsis algeriensis]|uniref:Integrase catalytic domain-containing protein n=1 Tax=Nocardiopsis algeriensis TaxID=1478215 RepID=A0A841IY39_9ACTN|nr:hypothetical protein [Nocardiopsis algeriensis]MBB6121071.1 hypothetical protein [Nocardiopsis algeriensis]